MATYDIRPLQLRMLEILLAFDKMCKEHNLNYGIMAGTLLGAVRHKGFIPWDDDMDVGMPRPDYEKFIAHCSEWLPAPYEFVCAENDPKYPLPFGKIQDDEKAKDEAIAQVASSEPEKLKPLFEDAKKCLFDCITVKTKESE